MDVTIRTWNQGAGPCFDTAEHADRADAVRALQEATTLTWVDVLDPGEGEFDPFASALDLAPLAVEDALTVHERPKSVHYGELLFVATYAITESGDTSRISMFLLDRGLLTVRLGDEFDIGAVAQNIELDDSLLEYGSRALEMMLLDAVVDGYTARATTIDEAVDDVESILFDASAGNRVSQATFSLHKDVSELRRIVLPMRDVVGSLLRRISASTELHELLPYAEDVYDHTMRASEWAENLRDSVESVRSTNLSLVDNQLNTVMKKLTSWAAIIAVPTAITGYFGQNVPYPGSGQHWGFWLSLGIMVVLAGTLYVTFRRRGWL